MGNDSGLIVERHQCPEANDYNGVRGHRYIECPLGQRIGEMDLFSSVITENDVSGPKYHIPSGDVEEEGCVLAEKDDSVQDGSDSGDDGFVKLEIAIYKVHHTADYLAEELEAQENEGNDHFVIDAMTLSCKS